MNSIRLQAADLLAILASQPESWPWCIDGLPGPWLRSARRIARAAWDEVYELYPSPQWRAIYAEAESMLRGGR